MNRRHFLNRSALAILATPFIGCSEDNKFRFKQGQIIGCFGDSITAEKNGYVAMLQSKIDSAHPTIGLKFINYGLSSETVTGLTEKDHPGPRPYLFERLDDILDKTPIDVALFCYGINDGIYGRPSKKLFNSFKIGVYSFLEKMRQRKIPAVLLTPPPLALEAAPIVTSSDIDFGYKNPYPKYEEEVLQEFERIILHMEHPYAKLEIDIHTPLLENQATCYDTDPIHPNQKGHELIADTIIRNLAF
ncbi:MAG TPA: GDSL-type esterase/lipase family protein [Pricia sp.]|nr:GDSL-type esterase/lipase family protein [Pricia sp.]